MSVKAFELLSVSKFRNISKIECIEAAGNDVYFGCSDGLILHTSIEERRDGDSNVVYSSNILCQTVLCTKKSIVTIKASSALGRLLVLSDGGLFLLDADVLATIGSGPKLRNVQAMCANENPNLNDPFALELCVAKKKCLLLCSLQEERISVTKEFPVQETPVNIAMDGKYVCVAGESNYYIYNVSTGSSVDLFPKDPSIIFPHVKRISKEEFLVTGPGNLGIFVTAAGTSERPPIQWGDAVLGFSYYHPYILTLTEAFIRVYSLIDQQHKQTIPFSGGALIGNFDGQIYIASDGSLHCLMPLPWTVQVMTLLENGSAEEAIELTEHSGGAGMCAEKYICFTQSVLQRAGFVRFAEGRFQEAQDYFIKGRLDIRELLSLFPGLLPSDWNYVRLQPPLHSLVDVNQAFHGHETRIKEATQFLKQFLVFLRCSGEHVSHEIELSSALVKLYCEDDVPELHRFLEGTTISSVSEDCFELLHNRGRFAALAKIYKCVGNYEKSLELIAMLLRSELNDDQFGGPKELADVVLSSANEEVLWRFADFILDVDPEEALRVFTEFKVNLEPSRVLKCLSRQPQIRARFLQYLIDVKGLKDEKYHTELVFFYINEVERLQKLNLDFGRDRHKLHSFLNSSESMNPKAVLSRLKNTNLILETASVYGKLNEHEKALKMLVRDLKDFNAAEQYCIRQSEGLLEENKSSIFTTLLKIYLEPVEKGQTANDAELGPALDLISNHAADLHLRAVLHILPSDWSVSITRRYMKGALRSSLHKYRMKKMEQSLVNVLNIQQKFISDKLCKDMGPIVLTKSSICCVCQKGFTMSEFSLYPNGVLVHRHCVKDPAVCPITRYAFKVKVA